MQTHFQHEVEQDYQYIRVSRSLFKQVIQLITFNGSSLKKYLQWAQAISMCFSCEFVSYLWYIHSHQGFFSEAALRSLCALHACG